MRDMVRELATGRIRGSAAAGGGVVQFLGVPYAGEVDGAARFRPAPPLRPWTGVRDATAIGPAAPQPPMSFPPSARSRRMLSLLTDMMCTEAQSENCLVLNIWEPVSPATNPRPVMVSLHGGAHTLGSGSMPVFDGASLASQHDVVVVSINHRLGALGYLFLADVLGEEYADSGNVGNLDIVAALRWVHDNAGAFGGDPSNVTIFGESGGGAKVSTLLATPAAEGLFQRAIVQSGPRLRASSQDAAAEVTRALLDDLDLASDPKQLLSAPVEAIVAAQVRVLGGPLGFGGPRTLGPVVDGGVLPRHPFDPDAPSVSASVPLLIGTTRDEMTFFTYPDERLDTLDDAGAIAAVLPLAGERAQHLYSVYSQTRPDATPTQRLAAMLTDRFRVGSIRMAERKAALGEAPVWMYRFDFASDVEDGALGAPHAMDVAFTFGNADAAALSGSRPERHDLARLTSAAWAAFARHGSPVTPELQTWASYEPERRTTMLLDVRCRSVEDPDAAEREAWDGIEIS